MNVRTRPPLLAALLFAVGVHAACHGRPADERSAVGEPERFQPLATGQPAPAYAVRTLSGDTVHVGAAALGAAGPTLLNVWATWCIPCQREFPELQRLHERYGARGLRVLAVSVDRGGDDKVAAFVRDHGATFTIGHDPDAQVQERYQTMGVPESFLIAADGTLLWRRVGELPASDPTLAAAVEQALPGSASAGTPAGAALGR